MEKFVKEWLASWNGGNPEKLLSYYHEGAFYRDPAMPSGLHGKEALRSYFTKLLAKNPEWKWEMLHLDQVSSSRFYLKWKATIPVGIQTVIEEGLDLVEIKDQLITRNEVYFDASKMLRKN